MAKDTANTDASTAADGAAKGDNAAAAEPAEAGTPNGEKPAKAGTPSTEDPPEAGTPKTYTQAEIDRMLAKEQKAWAKKAEDAEKKAKLSEDEKLKAENEELRNSLRMRDAKESVLADLRKAGARSPELMFSAVKGDLEFDDKGGLKNLKEIVDGLRLDHPEQFGIEKPGDGIDGGAGGKESGKKLTPEMLAKMTPAEINKLPWEEVSAVIAAGK